MQDVASRLANRVQLTTDAYRFYLTAVDNAFGTEIDYAQLHKIYSSESTGRQARADLLRMQRAPVDGGHVEYVIHGTRRPDVVHTRRGDR